MISKELTVQITDESESLIASETYFKVSKTNSTTKQGSGYLDGLNLSFKATLWNSTAINISLTLSNPFIKELR